MSHPDFSSLVRRQILRILNDCAGYLLPEPRLIEQVQLAVMPPPTTYEAQTEIYWLASQKMIVGVTPDLGGAPKYRITDLGKTELV